MKQEHCPENCEHPECTIPLCIDKLYKQFKRENAWHIVKKLTRQIESINDKIGAMNPSEAGYEEATEIYGEEIFKLQGSILKLKKKYNIT